MSAVTRRMVLAGLALVPAMARAAETTAWDFKFDGLDGVPLDFATLRGRVLLVANTASFCGYAPQFRGLEALNKGRGPDGLTVIGMPSNDFDQEADSDAKVKELCELTYGVDFPMVSLTHVRGPQVNPFYAWVHQARGWSPDWNFNKVLVGRDGRVAALFRAQAEPDGPVLTAAIARALSATV